MKAERHRLILEIIAERPIETQEDLVAELQSRGLQVTQATVSRDIKELRLVKVALPDGRYRYALPTGTMVGGDDPIHRVQRAFEEYVHAIDASGQIIVVRTEPGSAPVVAGAIDALEMDEILGTIAGDDTIFIVVKGDGAVPQSAATRSVFGRLSVLLPRRSDERG